MIDSSKMETDTSSFREQQHWQLIPLFGVEWCPEFLGTTVDSTIDLEAGYVSRLQCVNLQDKFASLAIWLLCLGAAISLKFIMLLRVRPDIRYTGPKKSMTSLHCTLTSRAETLIFQNSIRQYVPNWFQDTWNNFRLNSDFVAWQSQGKISIHGIPLNEILSHQATLRSLTNFLHNTHSLYFDSRRSTMHSA